MAIVCWHLCLSFNVFRLFLKDWMECHLQIKQYVVSIWNHTCSFRFALCCCFLQSELFFVLVEFVGQVVCARYSDEEYFKERCQGRICVFVRFQLFSTGSVIIVNVYVLSASLSHFGCWSDFVVGVIQALKETIICFSVHPIPFIYIPFVFNICHLLELISLF